MDKEHVVTIEETPTKPPKQDKVEEADDVKKDQNMVQIESPELVQHIVKNVIQPEYLRDITSSIVWRNRWKKLSYLFYILSKICTLSSSLLAFLELYFRVGYLAMASGCVSLMAVFLWQCGDYAVTISTNKTRTINNYLRMLKIEGLPEEAKMDITKKTKSGD